MAPPDGTLAPARRRPGPVRRVPAGLQAPGGATRDVLRARASPRRDRPHDIRSLDGLLRRSRSRRSRSTTSSLGRRSSRSGRPAATSPASSARTGTSASRARSTRSPTPPRRRRSPHAARAARLPERRLHLQRSGHLHGVRDRRRRRLSRARRARRSPSPRVTSTAAPRAEFYAHMDAANVDLKGFTERFYRRRCRRPISIRSRTRCAISGMRPTSGSRSPIS